MAKTNVEVLSHEALTYLIGIIKRITKVSEAIDDINIRTDGTFSSVKINTLLNILEQDCNEYTDRLVANLSRLELKLVTDETDITESNIMYLYKPDGATSYNQYVVIDGNKVLLGTCDINMADYYTITQADDKFVLKTDYDSLVTKVTDIETAIGDSTQLEDDISNEIVALKGKSALKTLTQAQYTELVTNGSVVVDGETITFNNDDYYVVSDDSENINLDKFNLKTYTTLEQLGLSAPTTVSNIFNTLPDNSIIILQNGTGDILTDAPINYGLLTIKKIKQNRTSIIYEGFTYATSIPNSIYIGKFSDSTGSNLTWIKVCTTSVEDIPVTDISMSSTYTSNPNCKYQVVNGICYVDFMSGTYKLTTNVNGVLLASGLPIPKTGQVCTTYVPWSCGDASKQVIVFVNGNGELILHASVNANATPMFCSFSYPVKKG